MSEYLIQGETLTAIADKIRVLSGTEDAMSLNAMENHVGEANTDVTTEAGLIAQIASALEGKAGGSGDTGSSMQVATGTFTSALDICANPVTVGGLNFEPKSLLVTLFSSASTHYFNANYASFVALAAGELFDNYSIVAKKSLSSYGVTQSDVVSVEFTQDGFILKAADTTVRSVGCPYVYYAFG